ncbi:Serine/threonine-protein phosphatase CPPED1 [Bagarius yarrelli]|uniref:Serine/threonine-protein phosphatase CPPED1 n=1 Tax=Bagarius yarrelli TaxID=175774 RepID=A0A556TIV1_BAGYA|nr:Serine/threonine-protein phosphatase CPPED1 [Bagarius yarrelli]
MAEDKNIFLRAKHRTYEGLTEDEEKQWRGPFCFIQAADPQLGLMKAWRVGDCDKGGDEWTEEVQLTKQAVEAINKLQPRPRFVVICCQFREEQERDLKNVLQAINPDIPLVFVSGNHDLGNTPTPDTVEQYCHAWGDDYFSFWVGGVLCLVLNSQLFFDSSGCCQLEESHEAWLEEQLQKAAKSSARHVIIFQHIPLYLKTPDEEDDYFSLQRSKRENLIQRFCRAGVKAVFSGHYHRNAGGCHAGLDMVVTSAIGCQLGKDAHGVRVVVVTADKIIHRYHSLDQLSEKGMDEDLKKLLC